MQQKFSHIFKVIALLLMSFSCEAQKFEWVNFFTGKDFQRDISMAVDSSGNQYSVFYFLKEIKFDTIFENNYNDYRGLVLKQDAEGNVLWHKVIVPLDSNYRVYPLTCKFNEAGNLIVLVSCNSSVVIGSDTVKSYFKNTGGTYVIEFDTEGNVLKGKNILDGTNLYNHNSNLSYPANRFTVDNDDNLYLALIYEGQVSILDSVNVKTYGTSSSPPRYIVCKFSPNGEKLKWIKELPFNTSGPTTLDELKTDIHGNLYAICNWGGSSSTVFMGKTLKNPQTNTGLLLIWDKWGNDKNWFYVESSDKKSSFGNIAPYDSNCIFMSGSYQGDSAKFGTKWKKNTKKGNYNFFASYDIHGNLKWVNVEDTTYSYSSQLKKSNTFGSMINYKDEYCYHSLEFGSARPPIFNGQKYISKNGSAQGLNMKLDNKGNILWGFWTRMPFQAMGIDGKNNLYFMGQWINDTMRFGNFTAIPDSWDAYIGKTYDYAIFRGDVNKGPYCAGDSMKIPYTKIGVFADTNIFYAELSDEFGNFNGKERELGRKKSKDSGTILGVLPMFQVVSSGNYRIRIRSTSPQAQSFYRLDTLRLLIYSKDKADPGPTEIICYGDSIKLSTYGGTKWKWSPKYNMNDSTLRQPLVWPTKTTTYKIIIADSSGCGAPDTAYKKIILRKPLKLSLAFNDTTVCDTSVLNIPMKFEGGDSTNYHWQAWSESSTKVWQKAAAGKLKLNDTLIHIPKVTITTPQKIAIILDDECTNKKDTAYLTIQLLNPSELSTRFKDTLLCMGNTISWKAKPVYGLSKNSVWEWRDITNSKVLSTNDSLSLTARVTTKIKLILTNGCTIDSNVFTFSVSPPLKANILSGKGNLNDTTLCLGQSLNLFAKGNGGAGKGYKYTWKINASVVSTANSIVLKPVIASNFILTLFLNDNCTIPSDSVSKIITVVETPKADFSYGVVCNKTNTDFKFTGTKPNSPVSTTFNWNFNNQDSSTNENPSHPFATSGTKNVTLTLTSSNRCKNEISKKVIVKVQSKADFTLNDICENDSAVFINKSQDATSYNWEFGDGAISNTPSAKHKYQMGVNPKKYPIKLVAVVKDGCSDSITKTISVFESPKADFSYSKICYFINTDFKFTGIKPKSPVTTSFRWNFNSEDSSFVENPSYLFSTPGNKIITMSLTSSSGCTDTLTKKIEIKPKANADFIANDVCETDSVVFKNVSKDATGYKWKFGDGNNSNIESPKHLYDIRGVSKTFNVSLVAIVPNGCSDSITKAISINANPVSDFSFIINQNKVDFKANQSGNTNYNWKFGNGDSATTSNKDYSYTYLKLTGKYTACLKTINAANCFSKICQEISITLGISTISKPTGFKIYPNPNTGSFTVEINKPTNEVSIEVYDILGNLIKTVETIPSKISYSIDMKVADGIYLVRVKNGAEVWTEKVSVGGVTNR